ncbi:5'-3' exonuclease [Rugosimonospora africana]|uniref:5'-3' exonuclease n=1 Tax=Rugosimonospora africana TaxID=556532 RepID=UPI001EF1AC29|nr:5'-3' exonuclease H3TH domain-containing protein [Rugosimonospora africana]
MAPSAPPLLLVLDGNSLLHRAYHAAATGQLVDASGRAVWALKGLVGYAARAAALLRPDALVVGFDCPDYSARKEHYSEYKAHRPEKPADLTDQITAAPALLNATGIATVVPHAYEADDVLASSAAHARRGGWRTVLMTSDRDSFALIDASTSVLRVRNGGFDQAVLVTSAALAETYGVTPSQYRDYAALRGDPSDNLRGVPGFGAATAARLLAAFGSVEQAWAVWDGGDHKAVCAVVGERSGEHFGSAAGRETIDRNRRLMAMRDDLPIPELHTLRLPLSLTVMKRALAGRGIILGPSLWALTGGLPPDAPDPAPLPQQWTRGSRRRRDPLPGQLALF